MLVVKTHYPAVIFEERPNFINFDKAVLLIRDPFEAVKSEFNRQKANGNHTGLASEEAFRMHWKNFTETKSIKWFEFHKYWLSKFINPQNIYILLYKSLVEHTENEVKKLLNYLNVKATNTDLACMMAHKEGLYHRAKIQTSLGVHFDDEIRQKMCTYIEKTIDLLRKRTNETNFSTNDMYCS